MTRRLKPCPFCGGKAKLTDGIYQEPVIDSNGAYVDMNFYELPIYAYCTKCHVETEGFELEGQAIRMWNRRVKRASGRKNIF